jgi:DNA polymerase alpha subunit A
MYGCLGFSNSRFFAQPIAALVTAMGRETLQRTVDIATNVVGLDVIYGDTDSIMINTRITDPTEFTKVLQLGEKVKQEVNKLYKTLELEIDGTFRAMLLLKKKKYAAVTAEYGPEGKLVFGKETKGLDLVRRDWCIQSKDSGRYVLDQILSGEDKEVVVKNIHEHLESLAEKMRSGVIPLEKFVITRGLSKHPNDYPDAKSQPHVQVAKHMLKNNLPVNTGDHIPYIICEPLEEQKGNNLSPVERARHPDEIRRSDGILKPDVEWYLSQQILPPISRLCEPIDGTSQTLLATKLGLEAKKYSQSLQSRLEIDDEELVDYTPASYLPDEERFKGVQKLQIRCQACDEAASFPGVFYTNQAGLLTCGLQCSNHACPKPHFLGFPSAMECLASISNSVNQLVHRCMQEYYTGTTVCDDPSCGLVTRQISVLGCCLARGCTGKLRVLVSERSLHTQLTYLKSLFDISHAVKKHSDVPKVELMKYLSKQDKICLDELHETANRFLSDSAYNWIEPSLWQRLFVVPTSIKQ